MAVVGGFLIDLRLSAQIPPAEKGLNGPLMCQERWAAGGGGLTMLFGVVGAAVCSASSVGKSTIGGGST